MRAALGALVGLDGDHHAGVAAEVAHFDVLGGMHHHEVVAVDGDPRAAHLRAAVGVKGHDVRQPA
jgi:hypothetical protein